MLIKTHIIKMLRKELFWLSNIYSIIINYCFTDLCAVVYLYFSYIILKIVIKDYLKEGYNGYNIQLFVIFLLLYLILLL